MHIWPQGGEVLHSSPGCKRRIRNTPITYLLSRLTVCHAPLTVNMNQSGLNASQKDGKDSGACEVCFGLFKFLPRDRTLSKHGFRDNLCPGSYSAPLNGPATHPPTAGVSASQSSATPLMASHCLHYHLPTRTHYLTLHGLPSF